MITQRQPIDYRALIENEEVLLIHDFYAETEWIDHLRFEGKKQEEIVHLNPVFRERLVREASGLFPGTFYPTDCGWIRATSSETQNLPAQSLHSDHPYLVLSICLSEQNETDPDHGTEFYRHREFGFKSLFGKKRPVHFANMFIEDREHGERWEKWFSHPFKKNTALIYPGSLLHRMPVHSWNSPEPRLLQIMNFRVPEGG